MARIGLGDLLAIRQYRKQRKQQQYHQQRKKKKSRCDCGDFDFCDCDCSPFMLGSMLSLMALSAPRTAPRRSTTGPGRAGVAAIRGYQRWLSPHLPFHCRQTPSCSQYGVEAVQRYGLVEGSRLTAARIKRCNPVTPRGTHDPVP